MHGQLITPLNKRRHVGFQLCVQCFLSPTPAMIKHGIDVMKQATNLLNPPCQIPVITFDQLALAKLIQWQFPATHTEGQHVATLGGLHTEMALWNVLGDLLEGSGWTSALSEAEVSSAGTAKSMLNAAHLTRTRHAHQVTLLTLHILQREAFLSCNGSEHKGTAEAWRLQMIAKSPTFMGAYFAIRNSYSHLCPGSQGEKRSFVCEHFGRTSTFVLCLRPCQLRKVATR